MAAEQAKEGLDIGFRARFFEALYGLHAYSGPDRIPGMAALERLCTENSELFNLLTMQVVREMGQLIVQARSLGTTLQDELKIRDMGHRVLSGIPGLNIQRRSTQDIRTERSRSGLADQGSPNPRLEQFLALFEGSL